MAMAQSGAIVIAWLASRASTLTAAAGDALDLSDVRNKQRSDRPMTQPTDYELVNACEQWLAATAVDDARVEALSRPVDTSAARESVRALLSASAAFARLSSAAQARVERDMTRIAEYLAPRDTGAAFAALVDEVNFPQFVAGLIHGVFDAVVNASIRQMEAYADLLASVTASLDEFRNEHITDTRLRDRLCAQFPWFCQSAAAGDEGLLRPLDRLAGGAWRRLATSRQQLLATMVMMGVNRIERSTRSTP
jgi:hypothetical protein